jgi:hypothetical protein
LFFQQRFFKSEIENPKSKIEKPCLPAIARRVKKGPLRPALCAFEFLFRTSIEAILRPSAFFLEPCAWSL